MTPPPSGLFLGRALDLETGALGADLRLDPRDLTTHGVVIGMTGSGKTGLCIDLLEEAALAGIPALAVDPKGDLGNLLLTFPGLSAREFAPWLPPGEAARLGLSEADHAERTAAAWKEGLAEWGLGGERIRALREAAEFVIYTPGSSAGMPVDVLSSFARPDLAWDDEEETLRESIRVSVSAVLQLVGVEADPLRSREHILLSHLVEHAWRAGDSADLPALIRGLQQPPFRQLGVFDVETFYPTRERMKLAVALNGILAAPGFRAWTRGARLDAAGLLRAPDGRPRVAIFHLGHLSEREKLFFTSLLLAAANVWMRRQGGTTDLRALVYVDEVVGMIPPYPLNPPTKEILLLLLKQARAFGLGVVLTTQNPVDVDYKVLTNAGTWFLGRLQTQGDKDRVLEGVVGLGGASGPSRAELDRILGALPPRGFLLHSARERAPLTFRTRWAMSYLRGPLTREDVERLTPDEARTAADAGRVASPGTQADANAPIAPTARTGATAGAPPRTRAATGAPAPAGEGASGSGPRSTVEEPPASGTAKGAPPHLPAISGGSHLFVTADGLPGLGDVRPAPDFVASPRRYEPALYAAAALRYDERKAGLDVRERAERLLFPLDGARLDWAASRPVELGTAVAADPPGPGDAASLPPALLARGALAQLKRAFTEHLLASATRELFHAPALDLYSRFDETREQFRARLAAENEARRDAEVAKLRAKYADRLAALQRRAEGQRADVAAADAAYEGRKREEVVSGAESVFGFLLGRKGTRAISQASRQRRMTETARLKAERERDEAAAAAAAVGELDAALAREVAEIAARWPDAPEIRTVDVPLERADVRVEAFGILWIPVAARLADSVG
ncbi:MAG TPA: hypothetical protein VIC56_05650 [Gemmatimonadota bacterium]